MSEQKDSLLASVGDISRVLVMGDLSKLNDTQRAQYYAKLCESLGLNPLTQPFEFIAFRGKLTLYARKCCTDQLRQIYKISIENPIIEQRDGFITVTVSARDANGRTDCDIGTVSTKDMGGDYANCIMKAITKAKRRVTLSICGLGMLDESELDTIPDAKPMGIPEVQAMPVVKVTPTPAIENKPATTTAPQKPKVSMDQVDALKARFDELNVSFGSPAIIERLKQLIGRQPSSMADLTVDEYEKIVKAMAAKQQAAKPAPSHDPYDGGDQGQDLHY